MRYDERATEWLVEQRFPHPSVSPYNRNATTSDVIWALRETGNDDSPPSLLIDDFDWEDNDFVPKDGFKIRGDRLVALEVLVKLSERCGQKYDRCRLHLTYF